MRMFILGLIICSISACQTVAQAGEETPILLTRVIGQLTQSNPKSVFQKCEIRQNQVENLVDVEQLITQIKGEEINVGFPFVPFVPSKEYYFLEGGKLELIARYSSKVETRQSSDSLVKLVDSICGRIDRK